ncbi:MAG: flagellar hook-basal body complex protein FliE [candidate division Zixibacteria bacterium]|nr:flagellar hook-basal body complex protein FliE [candidate division Zixibacteria bacterium]
MSEGSINSIKLIPGLADQIMVVKPGIEAVSPESKAEFGELLTDLINSVNQLHTESGNAQEALMNGDPVELHQVMIKAEEAGLATDLLLEIRNRLISAYNELIRMPI